MRLINKKGYEGGIEKEIINIIKNARNSIVIISPFIKINECEDEDEKSAYWKEIYDLLLKKSNEGLLIEVHTRLNQNNEKPDITEEDVRKKFKDIELENIYLHKNLHAKSYFNEKTVLITTLNLTDCSRNNIEIGYLTETEEEHKDFLIDFYYNELMKNDEDIIKKRTLLLKTNFNKLIEDKFSINTDTNDFKIECDNYKISVEIEESKSTKNNNDQTDTKKYKIYYCINIINKEYTFESGLIINYRCNELKVLKNENNNVTVIHDEFLSPIPLKNLLLNYYLFKEVNRGLFYLIKILEFKENEGIFKKTYK